jgi:hypothetical protein
MRAWHPACFRLSRVFAMRCVVHVRRSFDLSGQHYVLRLYPQFRWDERRAERFTSAGSLVERLEDLGVQRMDPGRSFPNLGGILDAVWNNIDVPREIFESFGRPGRAVADHTFAVA